MGRVMISRHGVGAVVVMGLALLSVASAADETLSGVWGSPLYRVQLTVSESNVTGTFTSLADPSAPPGTIAGEIQKDGRGFTAVWTFPLGSDTGTFKTSLRFAANGDVLTGFRSTSDGEPAAFALHRAVNGRVPVPVGPDDRGETRTRLTPTPRVYTLDGPSASVLLAQQYDHDHVLIRLNVTWTSPGSILDTVGIRAAAVGSFCLNVDAQGQIVLQVYAPALASGGKIANGWHLLTSSVRTVAGAPFEVTVAHRPEDWSLSVAAGGETRSVALALPMAPSGAPVYLGDFPGDDNFPASYNPHRGFSGHAEVVAFLGKTK